MIGVWFEDIDRKIRIRTNRFNVRLVVTDRDSYEIERKEYNHVQAPVFFEVFKGYLLSLNNEKDFDSQERYDTILKNFDIIFSA